MKMDAAKIKALAGLFLEGLMLVFIFVCSQSDFAVNNASKQEEPFDKMSSFHAVALRTSICTESIFHTFSRHAFTSGNFTIRFIDTPAIKLALSEALLISTYERNSFYVLLRDNAP
jgi:hypothetical protein